MKEAVKVNSQENGAFFSNQWVLSQDNFLVHFIVLATSLAVYYSDSYLILFYSKHIGLRYKALSSSL